MLEEVKKTGKLDGFTFGRKKDLCESYFQKVTSMFKSANKGSDNIGVTLSVNMPGGGYSTGGERPLLSNHSNGIETLHTKTDATLLMKVDPETLEPRGVTTQVKLHPALKGPFSAAHAKTDPKTGDLFNFNLEFKSKSIYRVFRTSLQTGNTEILATFPGKPAYLHSMFLTEKYVVLCVWNSHMSWNGISLLYNKNILDSISPFDRSQKATWYVVDRNGKGLVATYESEPFFCFHTINAWDQPSPSDPSETDIVCELSLYENTDVMHTFYYDNLMKKNAEKKSLSCLPRCSQFRLPSVNAARPPHMQPAELIFKADPMISMELPTINPKYLTHKHRFTYGTVDRLKSSFMDGIVKFDNSTQTAIFWDHEAHTPGEPIFIADPEGTEEDDGVLLTVVLDGVAEKSYLLVLNAKDLTEVGRAQMDGPMSFGFHGAHKAMGRPYAGDI